MDIWFEYRLGQYRDDDHWEETPLLRILTLHTPCYGYHSCVFELITLSSGNFSRIREVIFSPSSLTAQLICDKRFVHNAENVDANADRILFKVL